MLSLLWLVACTETYTLTGQVKDIWGKPVMDATVVVEGVVQRYHTDSAGKFEIELDRPPTRVLAGKDGYIKGVSAVPAVTEDVEEIAPLAFSLYPEPGQPGFYAVGPQDYIHLQAARIRVVGTELKHYAGIQDMPERAMSGNKTVDFVFSSTLRSSELARMDLHLSRLDFVDHTPVKGVLGRVDATVNLWVAAEEVPFELRSLPSKDDYLISTRQPLKSGIYAFHAQDVLNEDDERVLMNLPKEMQVAFPFEVL